VIGTQMNRSFMNRIISVTGVDGNPQPATWKILLEDQHAGGGVREVEVTNGRVSSERTPVRGVVGSSEGATIKAARLNLDSSGAYAVASHTADKSNTQFDTASYTLRTDERGDPVWIVTLHGRSGQPVGTIFIGANRGTVTRTEGMFSGATMQDVETDPESHPTKEGGVIGNAKSRIRATFLHAQEEARGMFERVRRSFVDFINRT
jgi:phage-related tail fiber protein